MKQQSEKDVLESVRSMRERGVEATGKLPSDAWSQIAEIIPK